MSEETMVILNRIFRHYSVGEYPKLNEILEGEIAPVTDKIITLFKDEELTFEECYRILDFTYQVLQYKSQKVNL